MNESASIFFVSTSPIRKFPSRKPTNEKTSIFCIINLIAAIVIFFLILFLHLRLNKNKLESFSSTSKSEDCYKNFYQCLKDENKKKTTQQ
jgi:uncharacterized membrane protein